MRIESSSKRLGTYMIAGLFMVLFALLFFNIFPESVSSYVLVVLGIFGILLFFLLYGVGGPKKTTSVDRDRLWKDRLDTKLSLREYILFVNRKLFFPGMLTVYLLYLFVKQTGLWGLDTTGLYLFVQENFLMAAALILGVFLPWKEGVDGSYIIEQQSSTHVRGMYVLSVCCSLVGIWVLSQQTQSLGKIGLIISLVGGALLFLVGVLLVEDDEDIEEKEDGSLPRKQFDETIFF